MIGVWAEYDEQTRNPARLRFLKQIAAMQKLVGVPVPSIGPQQIQQSQLQLENIILKYFKLATNTLQ